ncbi:MAG: glycosyl transferase family 8, partial [Candidatus Pacearchaeota archaeon]|nr:glycosyl transferase family 8 [Candidatus Pacearchaeota archaeon]
MKKKLTECLISNKTINAGFLLGPGKKMKSLCGKMLSLLKTYKKFGPDQIVVNYVLHEEGFIPLEKGYNFVISTAREFIEIKNGIF